MPRVETLQLREVTDIDKLTICLMLMIIANVLFSISNVPATGLRAFCGLFHLIFITAFEKGTIGLPVQQMGKLRLGIPCLVNQSRPSNLCLFGSSHLCSVVSFTYSQMIPSSYKLHSDTAHKGTLTVICLYNQYINVENDFYCSCTWTELTRNYKAKVTT